MYLTASFRQRCLLDLQSVSRHFVTSCNSRSVGDAGDDDNSNNSNNSNNGRQHRRGRHLETTQPFVQVLECDVSGNVTSISKSLADVARLRNETNLPIRDMRMFFQPRRNVQEDHMALILPRPASNCFLVSLEHIRLLCRRDKCFILHPEDPAVTAFANDLSRHLMMRSYSDIAPDEDIGDEGETTGKTKDANLHAFLDAVVADKRSSGAGDPTGGGRLDLAVLETSLAAVTNRFKRYLNLLKPVLDLLLHGTSSDPSASMLRRLLAFKNSLNDFERRVIMAREAVEEVLKKDVDLAGLSLRPQGEMEEEKDVAEVELLLEAYHADLRELECDLAGLKHQIEDTNDFINTHLNSMRNSFIQMTLFMEIGTLSVGVGALCAGVFGMNLATGLEETPNAFAVTTGGICLLVGTIFGVCANRYSALNKDFSSAKSFHALKMFFGFVKRVEDHLHLSDRENIDRAEFKQMLNSVVGEQLTEQEVDRIFRILDENRDGMLGKEELTGRQNVGQINSADTRSP